MKKIKEDMECIEELIRKVQLLTSPIAITAHDDFKWLMKRENGSKFKERYPKCVLPVNIGRTPVFLPVCNRMGIEDPEIMKLAHTIVCKLSGHHDKMKIEGEFKIVKLKLEELMRKFSKDISKPHDMGPTKTGATIALNKIKAYNDSIKGV